jgi:hypothetical protein
MGREAGAVAVVLIGVVAACEGRDEVPGGADADSDTDTGSGTGTATSSSTGKAPCLPPFVRCEDEEECVLPDADPANCGACGVVCGTDAPACLRGVCSSTCDDLVDCEGWCVDLATSPIHCGRCGEACPLPGTCTEGACRCPRDYQTMCANPEFGAGCHDLQTSAQACGDCENACDVEGGEVCYRGTCARDCGELTECGAGQCSDLQTDEYNCGVCSTYCGLGSNCCGGTCLRAAGGDADSDSDSDGCIGTDEIVGSD